MEWEAFEEGFRDGMDTVYENREKFKESIRADKLLPQDSDSDATHQSAEGVISSPSGVSEVISFILRLIDDAVVPVYNSYQSRSKKVKQLWGLVKTSARQTSAETAISNLNSLSP